MSILIEQINLNDLRSIVSEIIEEKFSKIDSFFESTISVVISRKAAAEILNVTPASINNYVSYGILKPVYKDGSSQMNYYLSEVLKLKEQRKSIPHLKKG
jgi:hypothetical protein